MAKRCGAKRCNSDLLCKHVVVPGRNRCYRHGGKSTGPQTPEGRQRTNDAARAGYRRYLAERRVLYAAGLIDKISPAGRKPGAGWVTKNMRAKRAEKIEEAPPSVDIEGALKAIETLRARLL
jgi:hypothetical protein